MTLRTKIAQGWSGLCKTLSFVWRQMPLRSTKTPEEPWPLDILPEEIIIRGICTPYHASASKRKLKPEAFDPTPGTDEVSVMRHRILNRDECKANAKQLEDLSQNKIYAGLAALRANEIIKIATGLVDSRDVYLGHADIKVIRREPGEPPTPENLRRLREMTKALQQVAQYYVDPAPGLVGWSGPNLDPQA